ncbi:hypothetical protein ACFQ0X_37465 [Streptomyces rectiviolaceus]|uniref:Uncharacterized protein n=1 Tax=Streptomyces rectiviolaceus TaxID=332591 RepID=A0ABP6NEQ0_9ACTN
MSRVRMSRFRLHRGAYGIPERAAHTDGSLSGRPAPPPDPSVRRP